MLMRGQGTIWYWMREGSVDPLHATNLYGKNTKLLASSCADVQTRNEV